MVVCWVGVVGFMHRRCWGWWLWSIIISVIVVVAVYFLWGEWLLFQLCMYSIKEFFNRVVRVGVVVAVGVGFLCLSGLFALRSVMTAYAAAPSVLFFPGEGSVTSASEANITLFFSGAIYADSSGTVFTNDTIDSLVEVRIGNSAGALVSSDAVVAGTAVVINPNVELPDGSVYVGLSDEWWYSDNGSYVQGSAQSALFSVDTVAPTVGFPSMSSGGGDARFAKEGDVIVVTLDFSKELNESETSILYRVGSDGDEKTFSFTEDVSIDSGECRETYDTGDVYTCEYTVAAGDNGSFGVRVSSFKDVAGNSGLDQRTFLSSVTIDTTAPVITPSALSVVASNWVAVRAADASTNTAYALTATTGASTSFLSDIHALTDGQVGYFNGDTAVSNTITDNRPDDRDGGVAGRFGNYIIAQSGVSSATNSFKPTFFYTQWDGSAWGEWESFGSAESGSSSADFPSYFKAEEDTDPLTAGRGGNIADFVSGTGGAIIAFTTAGSPAHEYRSGGSLIDGHDTVRYLAGYADGVLTVYQLFGLNPASDSIAKRWVKTIGQETVWKAKKLDSGATCGAASMEDAESYTENDMLHFEDSGDNGKFYCFSSTDRAGNTAYAASAPASGLVDGLTLSISIPSGYQSSKSVSVTASPVDLTAEYKLMTESVCDATSYGSGGTALGFSGGVATVTVSGGENNGKYLCFKVSRAGYLTHYIRSDAITGLNASGLSVSNVSYVSSATLYLQGKPVPGDIIGAGPGETFYPVVLFSNPVTEVISDGADARPKIVYETRTSGTTVVQQQFSIVSTTDEQSDAIDLALSSGECTRYRATSEYICAITVSPSLFNSGGDDVQFKAFVTDYSDLQGNHGNAQNYDTYSGFLALNLDQPGVLFTPPYGGYLNNAGANLSLDFSTNDLVATDASGTLLNNTSADTLVSIQQEGTPPSPPTALSFDGTYNSSTKTITVNPTNNLPEGRILFSVSDWWRGSSSGGNTTWTRVLGNTSTLTVDTTAPSVSFFPVSGGYVNSMEDDAPVVAGVSYTSDMDYAAVTISDSDAQTLDIVKSAGYLAPQLREVLSSSTPGLTDLTGLSYLGSSVAADGSTLVIGSRDGRTGNTVTGTVHILQDRNGNGSYADAGDVEVIDGNTPNVSISTFDRFGHAVAIKGSVLVVGVPQSDHGGADRGKAYVFKDTDGDGYFTDAGGHSVYSIHHGYEYITLKDGDHFGQAVAISDFGAIVIGLPGSSSRQAGWEDTPGRVFWFHDKNNDGDHFDAGEHFGIGQNEGSGFTTLLRAGDLFGSALAFYDRTLYIGAPGTDRNKQDAGEVYALTDRNRNGLFENFNDNVELPVQLSHYIPDLHLNWNGRFGAALATDAGKLFIGASTDRTSLGIRGAVYALEDKDFDHFFDGPGEFLKIDAHSIPGAAPVNYGYFGGALAVADGKLFTGVYEEYEDGNVGTVRVFDLVFGALLTPSEMQGLAEGTITVNATPTDLAGNTGSAVSGSFVYRTDAPIVSEPTVVTNFSSSTVSVTDDKSETTTMAYRVIALSDVCDAAAMSSDTTPYVEGSGLVLNDPADDRRKVCFSSTDVAGNVGYEDSAPLSVVTALYGSIGSVVPAGPAKQKTVTLSSVSEGVGVTYKLKGAGECNAIDFGTGDTILFLSNGSGTVTLSSESDNGKYVCFRLTKTNFADAFGQSGIVRGIDVTAPSMTVDPVSGGYVGAAEDDTDTSVSGSYAADIADVSFTAADGNVATSDVVRYVSDFARLLRGKISDTTGGIDLVNDLQSFGESVAVSGSKIYIGSGDEHNSGGIARGAVYILEDKNGDGDYLESGEVVKLSNDTAGLSLPSYGNFGSSIAVSGDQLFVGARADDAGGTNRGAVYILEDKNDDGDYSGAGEVVKIDSSFKGILLSDGDSFGTSVAVDGNMLYVGAIGDDDGNTESGAVYVFTDTDGDGVFTDPLGSSVRKISGVTDGISLSSFDYFGGSLGARDSVIYVGARGTDSGANDSGAVYVLDDINNDGDYAEDGEVLVLKNGSEGITLPVSAHFGSSIAVDSSKLYVGARGEQSGAGVFYVFEDKNNDGDFSDTSERVRVTGTDAGVSLSANDHFGSSIAAGGSLLVVGAPFGDDGGENRGEVYVFDLSFATSLTPAELQGLTEGTIIITAAPRDIVGNVGSAANSFVYDKAPPIIADPVFGVRNNMRTVRTADNDFLPTVMRYKLIEGGGVCDGVSMASGTTVYAEGTLLSFSNSTDEGKRVCFSSTDLADNTGYRASDVLTLVPPLVATISAFAPSKDAPRKTVMVSGVTAGAGVSYNLLSGSVCDSTTFGNTGTDLTFTGGIGTVTLSAAADNGKYLCFRVSKTNYTTVYFRSEQVSGLKPFLPVFTPADGALVNSASAVSASFSEGVFSDTAGAAFTNDTIDGIFSLKVGSASGTDIPFNATVSGSVVTVTPNAAFSDGVIYIAVSDSWYYGTGGVKTVGSAYSAYFTLDSTPPTVSLRSVSGGYVNAAEDDVSVPLLVDYRNDIETLALTVSDTDALTDDVSKQADRVGALFDREISDATEGVSLNAQRQKFGVSVFLDGDVLYVGSGEKTTSGGVASGAVYILEDKNADGDYLETGEVVELNNDTDGLTLPAYSNFGHAVAVSGDRLFVGAVADDTGGVNRGAVYILEDKNDDGDYLETGEVVKIDNTVAALSLSDNDSFGSSVAVAGNRLYVGAKGRGGSGAVYVLTDTDADGSFIDAGGSSVVIIGDATDGITLGAGDVFGMSVAVSGGVLYVGASGDDDDGADSGAVYVLEDKNGDGDYAESGENMKLSGLTLGISIEGGDHFGRSVFVDGDRLFVGVPVYGSGVNSVGAVYVLEDKNGDWQYDGTDEAILLSESAVGAPLSDSDAFGTSLAVSGSVLAVGVPGGDTGGTDLGEVHLLSLSFESALSSSETQGLTEGTVTVSGSATDLAGNTGTGSVSFVYDAVAPTVSTPTVNESGGVSSVSTTDDDAGTTVMRYKLIVVASSCDSTAMESATTVYTEGATLSFSEADASGKKVCFSSTDAAGNVGYAASTGLQVSPLSADVGAVLPSGSAQEKTVTLSSVTTGAAAEYKVIAESVCDATNYGVGTGTALTLSGGAGTVTLSSTSDNTKYVCFKLTKAGSVDAYFGSVQVTGIDPALPSFSPTDGSFVSDASSNVTISFSGAVYADSSGTAFTDTTVDAVVSLYVGSSSGTAIPFDATIDNTTHVITLDPTSSLSDGVVYVGLSNGWYYGSESTKTQGNAYSVLFTADSTSPTVTIPSVSGGYVNDDESDADVYVRANASVDTASVSFTMTDSVSYSVTRSSSSASSYMRTGEISDSTEGLSLPDGAWFGYALDVDDGKVYVGAPADASGSADGAVYVFEDKNSDGDYADTGEVVLINDAVDGVLLGTGSGFGASIFADGDVVYVGAPWTDYGSGAAGAMYVLEDKNDDGDYGESGEVFVINHTTANLTISPFDYFGIDAFVSGSKVYIGAPGVDTGIADSDRGAVYVLEDTNADGDYLDTGEVVVLNDTTLTSVSLPGLGFFGSAVFVDEGVLYVGAPGYDSWKGGVYVLEDKNSDGDYNDTGEVSVISSDLLSVSLPYSTTFGTAIAVSGDRLFVGAAGYDGIGFDQGAMYVLEDKNGDGDYADTGETTLLSGAMDGLTLDTSDQFGNAVAVDGNDLYVGTPWDDTGGTNNGIVHVFKGSFAVTLTPSDLEDFADGTITIGATATDGAGNTGTGSSSFVLDTSPPVIDVSSAGGNSDRPTVSGHDDDSATVSMVYKVLDAGVECNAASMASGTTSYTEGSTIAFTDPSLNGKKVCFASTDAAGNVGYAISGAIMVSSTLSATVGAPLPSGAAREKSVSISGVLDGAAVSYKLISSATCDSSSYGSGGTAVSLTQGAGSVTIANEGYNNLRVCFKVSKTNYQTVYLGSDLITGIDRTAPHAPTSLALSASDDSGSSNSDRVTNIVDDLTFIGCAEEGSLVQLYSVTDGPTYTAVGGSRGAGATDLTLCPLPGTKKFSVSIDLAAKMSAYTIVAKTSDAAGNESDASGSISLTVDSFAPTVGTPVLSGTGEEALVSVTDDDAEATVMKYTLLADGVDCNAFGMTGALAYAEGTNVRFTDVADNGKRVCFSSTDVAGNVGYGVSAAITIAPAVSIVVSTPDGSSASYKEVVVSSVSAGARVFYKSLTAGNCDASSFGSGGTEVTIASGNGSVVLSQNSDNGSFLCFRTEKTGHTTKYAASGVISGIDASDPTVTLAYQNQPSGGSAITSVVPGSDIYTVVSFSEPVQEVVHDGAAARPGIFYQAQNSGSVTVAEAQYDIIMSGSLASGDCKATTARRVYVCRYTLSSGIAAGTVFKSYVKVFEDTASNSGVAQSFSSVTEKVDVVANAEPTIFFHPQIGGYTNNKEVNVQLSFSSAFYKDSTGTAFTDSDISAVLTLKSGSSAGTDIPFSSSISGTTVILDPSSPLSEGDVYVGISDGWYYGSGGTKEQGSAQGGVFTVDTVSPTGTIDVIAGDDYVNGTEDDSPVVITGRVTDDDVPFVGVLVTGLGANPFVVIRTPVFLTDSVWSVTLSPVEMQSFSPGDILVSANISDRAGNPSLIPVQREFTYLPFVPPNDVGDTDPPTGNDGSSGGVGTQEYTFSGRTDPVNPVHVGDSVRLFDNDELVGEYVFTEEFPEGRAPWTITVVLEEGVHNFVIRFYDAAGNLSSGEESVGTIDNRKKGSRRGGGGGGGGSVPANPFTAPEFSEPDEDDFVFGFTSPGPLDDPTLPEEPLTLGDSSSDCASCAGAFE